MFGKEERESNCELRVSSAHKLDYDHNCLGSMITSGSDYVDHWTHAGGSCVFSLTEQHHSSLSRVKLMKRLNEDG